MSVAKQVATRAVREIQPFRTGGVSLKWNTGLPNQLPAIQADSPYFERWMAGFRYEQDEGYRRGMLHDDFNIFHDSDLEKICSRAPYELIQGMHMRVLRADLLAAKKKWLPKEEWTPMDADHLYLHPIKEAYEKEQNEIALVKCATGDWNDMVDWAEHLWFRVRRYREIKAAKELLSQNDANVFA